MGTAIEHPAPDRVKRQSDRMSKIRDRSERATGTTLRGLEHHSTHRIENHISEKHYRML